MSMSMHVLRSTEKAIKGCLLITSRSFVQQPVSAYPAVYMSAYPAVSLHLTWRNFHSFDRARSARDDLASENKSAHMFTMGKDLRRRQFLKKNWLPFECFRNAKTNHEMRDFSGLRN